MPSKIIVQGANAGVINVSGGPLVSAMMTNLAANAAASADNAASSALGIAALETAAAQSATAAATSEVLSSNWAEEVEDVAVTPGKFSAKHHAIKAAATLAQASNFVRNDADDALTAAYTVTAVADGNAPPAYWPTPLGANMKLLTNNAAFTFNAPVAPGSYTMVILLTNGAAPGTVSEAGWTLITGDSFSLVPGEKFLAYITRIDTVTHLHVQALQ